jgi:hypothetical protein
VKIVIGDLLVSNSFEVRVGNVYPVRGGRGASIGNMHVLFAITEKTRWGEAGGQALFLVIDREGNPVGVNTYRASILEEWCPIAFVDGLDGLSFTMRGL